MPTVGFDEVNEAPVFGQCTGVRYLLGTTSAYSLQDVGGIWPNGETYAFSATAVQFDDGDLAGSAPACSFFAYAINNGSSADVVAVMALAHSTAPDTTVFGANIIAMSHPGVHDVKLVGLEVDVEPSDGNRVGPGSGGIYVNAFNEHIPGAALQIGGVGGGTFTDGIILDGIIGAGIAPGTGSVMSSALNTSAGSYLESAIVLGNQHGIKMNNASGHPVVVMTDTSGNFRAFGNTGFIFQKSSLVEGSELFSARDGTGVEAISAKVARGSPSSTIACALRVNGQSITGRSINAGGTINANGADYAEYERIKAGSPPISKGDIVGFDKDGELTTIFDEAVSFCVKSTSPSIVGGDAWSIGLSEEEASEERHKWDRVAYCGKVPVNVYGATAGQWIIPVKTTSGGIAGQARTLSRSAALDAGAVGRVKRILKNGRAEIVVTL